MHDQEKGQREGNPTSRHQQRIKGRPGGVFQSCLEQGVRELRGERTQGAQKEGPRPGLDREPEGRGASEKGTPEDPRGAWAPGRYHFSSASGAALGANRNILEACQWSRKCQRPSKETSFLSQRKEPLVSLLLSNTILTSLSQPGGAPLPKTGLFQ